MPDPLTTFEEVRNEVGRNLGISDWTQPGNAFTTVDVNREINRAVAWVQFRALRVFTEFDTETWSFSIGLDVPEVDLPANFLREMTLWKIDTTKGAGGDNQRTQVRIIRAQQEAGWSGPSGEEVWVFRTRKGRRKGQSLPAGNYVLEYIATAPILTANADPIPLPKYLIEPVVLRATYRLSSTRNNEVLTARYQSDLAEWQAEIEKQGEVLDGLRHGDTTPRQSKDFTEGSLFALMERVRLECFAHVPTEILSPDRLRIWVNESCQDVQRILLILNEEWDAEKVELDLNGTDFVFPLPNNTLRVNLVEIQTTGPGGELQWLPIDFGRPQDRDWYRFAPTIRGGEVLVGKWVMEGQTIVSKSSSAPVGRLRFNVARIVTPMRADTDETKIPAQYHGAIVSKAANRAANALNKDGICQSLVISTFAQWSEWVKDIKDTGRLRNLARRDVVHDEQGYTDECAEW